jgi:hypothetical protein
MSTEKKATPAEPHSQATNKGVSAELSEEALANLTGYFDVLIRMDFAQKQRNERNKDVDALHSTSNNTTQAD